MKPIIKIVNSETGEEIEREMNDQEYAVYLTDKERAEARVIAETEKQSAKNAVLEKLGITEEEAKLLLS